MNQLHSKHLASIKGKDNLGLVLLFSTAYNLGDTVCPRSSDPFYIVIYYIKWVTTYWTYSTMLWTGSCTADPLGARGRNIMPRKEMQHK